MPSTDRVHSITTASSYVALQTPKEEWEARLAHIRESKEFLYATTYFIDYDRFGEIYLNALMEAAQRGVAVTLVLDSFGQKVSSVMMQKEESQRLRDKLVELRERGVTLHYYWVQGMLRRLVGYGTHIKIQINETGSAIFSSGNISRTSFEQWREYALRFEGKIALHFMNTMRLLCPVAPEHYQRLEETVMMHEDKHHMDYIAYSPVKEIFLKRFRKKDFNPITQKIRDMIQQAQQNIKITSFYFKPTKEIVNDLLAAAKRGVQIDIFHSHRKAFWGNDLAWLPSFIGYPKLLNAGIAMHESMTGEHSKVMLVDDKAIMFGSYNFEHAAHERLAEAMIHTEDQDMVSKKKSMFAQLAASSNFIRVDKEYLATLPARLKVKAWVVGPIKHFF